MSGELTQLAAVGHQDAWLTEKPDITLFKGSYKRHTNFAIGNFEQSFNTAVGYDKRMEATIGRNGDLVYQMYVVLELAALTSTNANVRTNPTDPNTPYVPAPGSNYSPYHLSYCNAVGHALIETVEVIIGGHKFDRHTGDFMNIYESLSRPVGKELGAIVGQAATPGELDDLRMRDQRLYVPLLFWFNRFREKVLPLIALQYHDVKLILKTRKKEEVIVLGTAIDPSVTSGAAGYSGGEMVNAYLLVNYVFLDGGERKLFAQHQHEYLIDQLQFNGHESKASTKTQFNIPLNFNHPVKEIIWVIQQQSAIQAKEYFNYEGAPDWSAGASTGLNNTYDPLIHAGLMLNGHDRFQHHAGPYYRQITALESHTRIPNNFIYLYSFSLNPESWRPEGSCNFSRIDTAVLQLTTQAFEGEIRIYARNVNVMKVTSGMAGLRYAN